MASPSFQLTSGFNPGYFRRLIEQVNPQLSRFKESALELLLAITDAMRMGQPFNPAAKDRIQEMVYFVPYDKQQKYKKALEYLRDSAKISLGGRPASPGMEFEKLQVGEFAYVANGQTVHMNPGSFHHVFRFTWKSSNGNLESLRGVGTRESVTFRTSPAAPPFNYVQASIPMTFNQGSTDGGQWGGCSDDHSTKHPRLVCASPRVAGELVAEQWYQYTTDRGATWKNIPEAAYLIIKGVRPRGGEMVYFFKKTNWEQHNRKQFHFEVEYKIGDPPNPMPPAGIKLSMQSGTDANLKQYVLRVISMK
jgi:hypothetical protein